MEVVHSNITTSPTSQTATTGQRARVKRMIELWNARDDRQFEKENAAEIKELRILEEQEQA